MRIERVNPPPAAERVWLAAAGAAMRIERVNPPLAADRVWRALRERP